MPEEPAAQDLPCAPPPPIVAAWHVDTRLTGVKIAGALIFAIMALVLHGDRIGLPLAALACAVLLVYAARDLLAPVRLAADAEGITVVTGVRRRKRLRWDQIDRVRVDRRRRLGTVSELLEIDAGDTLHLFSSYDLGTSVREARQTLVAVRTNSLKR
jgi:hypothetical protein